MNLQATFEVRKIIERAKFDPCSITADEKAALKKMNWHGASFKFSSYNIDRQFKDLSIFKSSKLAAIKAAKDYEILLEKKKLQEYDYANQLLFHKKKIEQAKNKCLIALLENKKSLEARMQHAALIIQKITRGHLVRKKYRKILSELYMKNLTNKIKNLEGVVDKCYKYMGESGYKAAVFLQKNVRKFLCVRRFIKAKEQAYESRAILRINKVITIQCYIRGYLARKKYRKLLEDRYIAKTLEKIRIRLLVLRLKDFWHRKKFVWQVIQRKYREMSEDVSDDKKKSEAGSENFDLFLSDITKTFSKMNSIHDVFRVESKRNTVILKESFVPVKEFIVERKVKAVRPMAMKYLLPTATFINRTAKDEQETEDLKPYKHKKSISGKGFQRITLSRATYIKELKEKKIKKRAASADYQRNKAMSSVRQNNTIEKYPEKKSPQIFTPIYLSDFLKNKKNKTPTPNLLLQKVEEFPTPICEETMEKVYIYNAPAPQGLSFLDELPDVNSLLETYARNLKTKK